MNQDNNINVNNYNNDNQNNSLQDNNIGINNINPQVMTEQNIEDNSKINVSSDTTTQQNMTLNNVKKPINIKLLLIIIALILAVGVGWFLINNNSNSLENNTEVNNNDQPKSNTDIKYINDVKNDSEKIAMFLKYSTHLDYVITFDLDNSMKLPDDYLLDALDEKLDLEILDDDYEIKIKIDDVFIETDDDEFDEEYESIVKQSGNWYLTSDGEYNNIYLKLSDNNWVKFDLMNSSFDYVHEEYFEKLIEMVNVYVVKQEDDKLSFNDFDGNTINLNDYVFINDNIASSLSKYKVYLRNPEYIFDAQNEDGLSYSNDKMIFIRLDTSENLTKDLEKYTKSDNEKYNNEEYEVYFNENIHSLTMSRKVEDKFLVLSTFYSTEETIEEAINRIEKEVL